MNRLIPILATCALPLLALAQATNILRNPGFEADPAGGSGGMLNFMAVSKMDRLGADNKNTLNK